MPYQYGSHAAHKQNFQSSSKLYRTLQVKSYFYKDHYGDSKSDLLKNQSAFVNIRWSLLWQITNFFREHKFWSKEV